MEEGREGHCDESLSSDTNLLPSRADSWFSYRPVMKIF